MSLRRPAGLDALAWNADGLVPVVVQEVATGAVLMLAWADREALARTLDRGEGWFWSRSRRRLWRKGETSGNALAVVEVAVDCDGDAVLYRVDAAGPTCHTGARSCFEEAGADVVVTSPARVGEPGGTNDEAGGESATVERPRRGVDMAPPRLDEGVAGRAGRDEIATGAVGQRARGGEEAAGMRSAASADRGAEVAVRLAAGERSSTSDAGDAEHAAQRPEPTAGGAVGEADRRAPAGPRLELGWLWDVLRDRAAAHPAASYTARLLAAGIDRIARKVGEEATEVVIAALRAAPPPRTPVGGSAPSAASTLAAEAADLLYHLLVLLLAAGTAPDEVAAELRRRHGRPATPASPKPEGPPPDRPFTPAAVRPEDRR